MKILKDFSYKKASDIIKIINRHEFKNINFKYSDFSACDFEDLKISNCTFSHCIFVKSNAILKNFHDCIFSFCDFSYTKFFTKRSMTEIKSNNCIMFKCEYTHTYENSILYPKESYIVDSYKLHVRKRKTYKKIFIISNRFKIKNNTLSLCV